MNLLNKTKQLDEELSRYRLISISVKKTPRGITIIKVFRTVGTFQGFITKVFRFNKTELKKFKTIKKLAKHLNKQTPTGGLKFKTLW